MNTKVLMFGWEFPPYNSGGLGTACFGLTQALSALGIHITFVLPKKLGDFSSPLEMLFADVPGSVKFKSVPSLLYPYITGSTYSRERLEAKSCVYGLNLIEEVRLYGERSKDLVKDLDFDIIHAHDWLSFPAGLAAKELTGKPLVVHVHATEFDRTGGHGVNEEVYRIEKEGMDKADGIIAVSQWTKNILTDKYGIAPDKVRVVHNGITPGDYRLLPSKLAELKQDGSQIVLFVGRITIQKGPDYFIKVAKRVLDQNPKVYFIIAGSGDMEWQIMRQAASLGLSDRVIFAGFARGQELDSLYQAADLYVLPSVSEPFGITPLESLANGTPVLVSKQSGVAEVLTHALKADFWDVDEMANQIVSTLAYPALHNVLKENGTAEVKKITWLEAAAKCLNFYDQLSLGYN